MSNTPADGNIFLFYWKETSSYFNEKKPVFYFTIVICLWILPLRFIFLFDWTNVFVLNENFFHNIFLKILFYISKKKKFFQLNWQNIFFFVSFTEKNISIILSENFNWLYWEKIPFHLIEGKSLSSLLLEIHFILLTEKIFSC